MTKKADFGPNLVVFGQKILFFTGEVKSFVTHVTETHLGTLFTFFFDWAGYEMGQKCQYLAQNNQKCIFWAKFLIFYGSK